MTRTTRAVFVLGDSRQVASSLDTVGMRSVAQVGRFCLQEAIHGSDQPSGTLAARGSAQFDVSDRADWASFEVAVERQMLGSKP